MFISPKQLLGLMAIAVFIAVISSILSILLYKNYFSNPTIVPFTASSSDNNYDYKLAALGNIANNYALSDFSKSAERAMPAVVYISIQKRNPYTYPKYFDSYKNQQQYKDLLEYSHYATGSGVIISTDGYIITNTHVVEQGDDIEVTLWNEQKYKATLIGTDKASDIALLKINQNNLPYLFVGNSDELSVGEWVLAIGNPFKLTSTVSAGIVCAKGRNIGVLDDDAALESFIQTDAVVNQGNSGGALVNLKGELVGINTAIATSNGNFTGFSFAIPSNIALKVVEDIKQYGLVQRANLGVNVQNIDDSIIGVVKPLKGVYINDVTPNSTAALGGLRKGDVIVEINGYAIANANDYQEKMARYRPGDVLRIVFLRNTYEYITDVVLRNINNKIGIVHDTSAEIEKLLGTDFEDIAPTELSRYNLRNGVKVQRISSGILQRNTTIRSGFIIIRVNGEAVKSEADLLSFFSKVPPGTSVLIEGVYPGNAQLSRYAFSFK
ncbi:MAG: trypsin-like peptidase domain-containing protein [Chitinophagales bacterium]|nr:trypsin-like peptidase domain-containing protein [Bacteroidota bacterium]